MRYCINCGTMNDTDARYCSGCGKKFDSAPEINPEQADSYGTQQDAGAEAGAAGQASQGFNETAGNTSDNSGQTGYGAAYEQNAYNNGNQTGYSNYSDQTNPYGSGQQMRSDGITENKYKGYSIASMILGICSIVFSFIVPVLPLAAAIVGLVLGNKAKKYGDNGMAKTGRITSIVGIVLIGVCVILIIVGVIALGTAIASNPQLFEDIMNEYGTLR